MNFLPLCVGRSCVSNLDVTRGDAQLVILEIACAPPREFPSPFLTLPCLALPCPASRCTAAPPRDAALGRPPAISIHQPYSSALAALPMVILSLRALTTRAAASTLSSSPLQPAPPRVPSPLSTQCCPVPRAFVHVAREEIFFFCAPEAHHPGDARAMQGAVMPPPCNGCRRVLRRAALLRCMLRGPAGFTSAAMPACVLAAFFACAPHVRDGSVARSGWGIACLAAKGGNCWFEGLAVWRRAFVGVCGGYGWAVGRLGEGVERRGGRR